MRRIYKYQVFTLDRQTISLPRGAKILDVRPQDGQVQLWALVDPAESWETVELRVVGTGHDFPDADDWAHLSTFQLDGGGLVFHAFLKKERAS